MKSITIPASARDAIVANLAGHSRNLYAVFRDRLKQLRPNESGGITYNFMTTSDPRGAVTRMRGALADALTLGQIPDTDKAKAIRALERLDKALAKR